jgi:hypothetical protein
MLRTPLLLITTMLLALAFLPATVDAHPPPPETSGIQLWLSGDPGEQVLIRDGIGAASEGSMRVSSLGELDLGTWESPELTSDLNITQTQLTVVMYANPIGIVAGAGITISVVFSVDGDILTSGESDVVILNEPLMTNVPWQSERFDLNASAGSRLEVSVTAQLDGIGAADIIWGRADAPALTGLDVWEPPAAVVIAPMDDHWALDLQLDTSWNCSDLNSASLLIAGPVADHDQEWPQDPAPGVVEKVTGEGCIRTGHMHIEDGTYLYRWQLEMTDAETFNISGYFETESINVDTIDADFHWLGALLGIIAAVLPLILVSGGISSGFSAMSSQMGTIPMLAIAGAVAGGLLGAPMTILLAGSVAALMWAIKPIL